jgi:hypothetical protein
VDALIEDLIDYLNRNGPAFSFLAALVLALITAVYVLYTWRLVKSHEHATRVLTEPVVVPRVEMTPDGLQVIVRNASSAVASGVCIYTGSGSIATVRERPTYLTLFSGEEAHFHLDLADHEGTTTEYMKVLWGGAELLYADAHETLLIRTRIYVEEYRDPPRTSSFVMRVGVARERHDRKTLIERSMRQVQTKLDDPRQTWPLSQLWIAANDPFEG